jgi:hypothetical protein
MDIHAEDPVALGLTTALASLRRNWPFVGALGFRGTGFCTVYRHLLKTLWIITGIICE